MTKDTTFRTMHDIGLAAWFGGSLFGVTGLNAAAEEAPDQRTTQLISSIGWAKWSPVNLAAIAVHTVGGLGMLDRNRNRAAAQRGVGATAGVKLALTGAALAATAYSRVLGKKIENAAVHASRDVPSTATSHASSATTQAGRAGDVAQGAQQADKIAGQALGDVAERLPLDVRQAQHQLSYVQVAIPVLTGALVVLTARAGEEQKPGEQLKGLARSAGSAVGLPV